MFTKIKNFFLIYLEMSQPSNANASYADILKREFELKSEVDRKWE